MTISLHPHNEANKSLSLRAPRQLSQTLNRLTRKQRIQLVRKTFVNIVISLLPYLIIVVIVLVVLKELLAERKCETFLLSAMADSCNSFEAAVTSLLVILRFRKSKYIEEGDSCYWLLFSRTVAFAEAVVFLASGIGVLLLFLAWREFAGNDMLLLVVSALMGIGCKCIALAIDARVELLGTFREESLAVS